MDAEGIPPFRLVRTPPREEAYAHKGMLNIVQRSLGGSHFAIRYNNADSWAHFQFSSEEKNIDFY